MNARSKLINRNTISWLSHRSTSPLKYRLLPAEYKMHTIIEQIFGGFDKNDNGVLELSEMQKMFSDNSIHISMAELKQLFKIVARHTGYLTLEEFKKLTLSKEANEKFKQIFAKAVSNSPIKNEHYSHNFNRLISKFSQNGNYKKIQQSIDNIKSKLGNENAFLVPIRFSELFDAIKIKNEVIESFKIDASSHRALPTHTRLKSLNSIERDATLDEEFIKRRSMMECKKILETSKKEGMEEAERIKHVTKPNFPMPYQPHRLFCTTQSFLSSPIKQKIKCPPLTDMKYKSMIMKSINPFYSEMKPHLT